MDGILKPCPGCGSVDTEYCHNDSSGIAGGRYESYYHCMNPKCGWESPMGPEEQSIALWNKRSDGEYDYQAGKAALETELLLMVDGYNLPFSTNGLDVDEVIALLCSKLVDFATQLEGYKDLPASEVPSSLYWLLENIKENERTRIHEKIKDNLFDLVYRDDKEENS